MPAYFVTSTGTEIGKTLVTAALIHQLRARGVTVAAYKPILSGLDDADLADTDTGILLRAMGREVNGENFAALTPWGFGPALSPDMAAAREGRDIDFDEVVAFSRAALEGPEDVILIEGVGGLMAPIGTDHTVFDWLAALRTPALMVIGGYLGTISHTLTAARTLQSAGVELAGMIMSAKGAVPVPPAETAASIARFLPSVALAHLPDLGTPARAWEAAPDLVTPLGIPHTSA